VGTNYDTLYKSERHVLGAPTKDFVDFFASLENRALTVLDIGAGQGRDALFIARQGHAVTAVDLSPSGMKQLQEDADSEGLKIKTHVADICDFVPPHSFDIILIDRTLHMLDAPNRTSVLTSLLPYTNSNGFLLIADERSNIPAFEAVLETSDHDWTVLMQKKGFLFAQRT